MQGLHSVIFFRARTCIKPGHMLHHFVCSKPHMADVVSDVFLSFFCCCFYHPGGHRGVGRQHHSNGHSVPAGGSAAYHHRGAGVTARRSRPVSLQTVELKVRMCCEGCERVVRHALQNLRGVDSVEVDVPMEKVAVTGYLDRGKVLRKVRRSGKKAEFWPSGGTPMRFTSPRSYFRDAASYREGYNYRRHGYSNGDRHARMREPARGADPIGNLFNDDDVNAACRIM
ncbi:heavy metal-associated isoprenylated plant protein 30-like [Phragmites australis]|uniref:heavy metal-associated isoprenylated plant protein 30-like n=1 Tax=Phragmites australis TaxID=29695 RepID=UPI002D79A4D0|nr:heavy metal-associated isoprenylated plant protein 30-like [Phragmites australis]